ncbi:MAG: protein kinase domain-containing protein, partial [Gemmatimonadaceae bacterium]
VLGAERFIQEITTTAALQHPHILPLFDSGEAGKRESGEGTFLYYVMPFIDGETLRAKLDRETQLSIDESVKITVAVADALDYAHRHGVVHRDIKPENILLHDGRPMVMDFGIALALSAAAGGRLTETGLSLGTPHYMSPEQATAEKTITGRSDIYSLASVLYEMLTGDPPHTGSSAQQIIMKIIAEPAEAVTKYRKHVPPNVAAAIGTALEKLPADRFPTAASFAAALGDRGFVGAVAPVHGRLSLSRSRPMIAGIAALLLVVGGIVAWGWMRPRPVAAPAQYATSLVAGENRDGIALALETAIHPRGTSIVFREPLVGDREQYVPRAGEGQLYVKRQSDLVAQPLAGTDGGTAPFFSPDGEWVGYFVGHQLRKIPSGGGTSLLLADSVNTVYASGAWLADGSIVFHDWPNLRRLSPSGVSRVIVPLAPLEGRLPWLPSPLPDSRGVLFAVCGVSGQSTCARSQVYVYDARRDSVHLLFKDASSAWYAAGRVIYLAQNGTLLAVPWDNDALRATGPAITLLDGVQPPGFIISADGTALYVLGPPLFGSGPALNAEMVWVDRTGAVAPLDPLDPSWRFNAGALRWGFDLSPDGRRLAIQLRTDLGDDIWVRDLPSGQPSRITFYGGEDAVPAWTRDGRAVTFLSDRPTQADSSHRLRRWEQSVDGLADARLLSAGDALADGVRSPDSRWVAYLSNETGAPEVYVRPFPETGQAKWQVSHGTATVPVWSHDGHELFYVKDGNMMA